MISKIQDRIVWAIMLVWAIHGGTTGLAGWLLDLAAWVAALGTGPEPTDTGEEPPW